MEKEPHNKQADLDRQIEAKEVRKIRARKKEKHSVLSGLGMFGLVGWSVVVPTLLGAALGGWLDAKQQDGPSWTLNLLLIGLVIGCLNAWYWVQKENKDIHKDLEDDER
jgi:ATP synthase protein I